MITGGLCRLLFDGQVLTEPDTALAFGLALSAGPEPAYSASWLDGFLTGSGLISLYDQARWKLLSVWVAALDPAQFGHLMPDDTILVLITDLYEGGNAQNMRQRMSELVALGVQIIMLLALDDAGAPSFDQQHARFLVGLGVSVFACTPDLFPDLMAAAINKQDLIQWAGDNGVVLRGR